MLKSGLMRVRLQARFRVIPRVDSRLIHQFKKEPLAHFRIVLCCSLLSLSSHFLQDLSSNCSAATQNTTSTDVLGRLGGSINCSTKFCSAARLLLAPETSQRRQLHARIHLFDSDLLFACLPLSRSYTHSCAPQGMLLMC